MIILRKLEDLRTWRRNQSVGPDGIRPRRLATALEPPILGLVPTLGALHRGHGALIGQSRSECKLTVVSIYVNPTQFNRPEDFSKYPRTLETDAAYCESLGVDAIWAPDDHEMYPQPLKTYVEVQDLTNSLCGAFRPGHFRGVTTVVAKLFLQVQPDRAYFGEKDAQQLAVILRMTADLAFPVRIVPVPTVRECDGLALSSRNELLSEEQRRNAPRIYRALLVAKAAIEAGETSPRKVLTAATNLLQEAKDLRIEYLELVDPADLHPVETVDQPVLIAVAAWLGETRLIDNIRAAPPAPHVD